MASNLKGKKIAFLATDGFEQAELLEPRRALDEAGATTVVVSPKSGEIKAWDMKDWGKTVKVDKLLDDSNPNEYDALVLPGGVINPDHLRMDPKAVNFVRQFVATGKPVAAICHGPWGRSGGCQRRPVHLQPQARRHSRLQQRHHRGCDPGWPPKRSSLTPAASRILNSRQAFTADTSPPQRTAGPPSGSTPPHPQA